MATSTKRNILDILICLKNIDNTISLFESIGINIEDDTDNNVGHNIWDTTTRLCDTLCRMTNADIEDPEITDKIMTFVKTTDIENEKTVDLFVENFSD